jgi:hypothetical protein
LQVDLALVPVLALSVIAGGGVVSVVGLLAGRVCTTHSPYVVWTLSSMIWVLAMVVIYFILGLPLTLLFLSPVLFCVLPVAYLFTRSG